MPAISPFREKAGGEYHILGTKASPPHISCPNNRFFSSTVFARTVYDISKALRQNGERGWISTPPHWRRISSNRLMAVPPFMAKHGSIDGMQRTTSSAC
jgi:hypothetical protein